MNPDEQLRRLRDPSRWDDTTLRPRTRAASRLVRRLLIPATVAAALAVLAVISLTQIGAAPPADRGALPTAPNPSAPRSAGNTLPWLAIRPDQIGINALATHLDAPSCTTSDFSYDFRWQGTVMGYVQAPLYLTQTSHRTCALSDGLALQSVKNGTRQTVARLPLTALAPGATRVAVPPKARIMLRVTTSPPNDQLVDRNRTDPTWLVLQGTPVRLPGFLPSNAVDNKIGLTYENPADPQDNGTGPYAQVRATVTTPPQATAGRVLHYAITLTNTTSEPFVFGPVCPTYTEEANAFGTPEPVHTEATYLLNCDTAPTIQAGHSLTFAMQLTIPTSAKGQLRLGWFMSNGPSTATIVTNQVTRK